MDRIVTDSKILTPERSDSRSFNVLNIITIAHQNNLVLISCPPRHFHVEVVLKVELKVVAKVVKMKEVVVVEEVRVVDKREVVLKEVKVVELEEKRV